MVRLEIETQTPARHLYINVDCYLTSLEPQFSFFQYLGQATNQTRAIKNTQTMTKKAQQTNLH